MTIDGICLGCGRACARYADGWAGFCAACIPIVRDVTSRDDFRDLVAALVGLRELTPHLWQQGARATDYIRRFVLA